MQVTSADGTPIHVEVDGERDAPPVMLVHGVLGSTATWDWVVPHLVDGHRVVRLDLRGHGRSGRAPGRYLLDGYIGDVVAVLEDVVRAPALVVGHSLGGVTVAAVAQRRPELVGRLLLEDPALGLVEPMDGPPSGPLIDTFHLVRRGMPAVQARGTTPEALAPRLAQARTSFGDLAKERYHDDTMLAWARSQLAVDVEVLDPILDPAPDHLGAVLDLDSPIPVPGRVVAATASDRVVGHHAEARLAAASPQLTVHRIDGAGHNLHDERDHRDTFLAHLDAELAALVDHHRSDR